jgi:hypothetical protein
LGRLLDYGRCTYRPPQDLTDFVVARDQTSRFPYSDVPAQRCELDHQYDWDFGGPTEPGNLESLTRRQHHLKHETDWSVTGDPAGPLTWTSPTGRVYISDPTTYPIDRTLAPTPDEDQQDDPDPPPF